MKIRTALCVVLVLALTGCVSLFPKAPPAQLYRFGVQEGPAQSASGAAEFNVVRMPTAFDHAAEGDRILTVDGLQAAYIANSRWEAPAAVLFDEAETQAFERSGGPARLLRAGDAGAPAVGLRLEVQTFEVRYVNGGKGGTTVVVSVHALLTDMVDRKIIGDRVFESRQAAAENRVGAIVQAFNAATDDALTQIVAWTGRRGAD